MLPADLLSSRVLLLNDCCRYPFHLERL
jgi:hypothetical protein